MLDKQFLEETFPGGVVSHGDFGLNSSRREESFISGRDIFLDRNDKIEIGIVAQTSKYFFVKENFVPKENGGIFVSPLPKIIFDPEYFDQKISNSPAVQAGEYNLLDSATEEKMIEYSKKRGYFISYDLSQLHSMCLGANFLWNTLNKESTNYFLPLSSKKGTLLARINFYQQDGFLVVIEKPSEEFVWHQGVLLARYQALKDPTKLNFSYF